MTTKTRINKKIIAISVLIAILFVSAISATILYYNGVVNQKDSQIANQNNETANINDEIANLTSQNSNLKGQITNLTSAYLVNALGISEVGNTSEEFFIPYYYRLYIAGSVTNTGEGTADNAGLHVVAYSADGTLEINMTVPLSSGVTFRTDAEINSYLEEHNYGVSSLQLGILYSGQTSTIDLDIYHEGIVANWTVTPVWTNTP